MKIKSGLLLLVAGFLLDFIGVWMKVVHLPFAGELLALAVVLKVVGLILFTFSLLAHPKVKEFLHDNKSKNS